METRGSDSIFRHVLRCIFVSSLFLSVVPPGVSGKCSLLSSKFSNVMIEVDWWSILPYSSHEKGKKGNYTYNGIFPKLLKSFSNITGVKASYNEPMSNYINFTSVINSKNDTVYFPVMKEGETDDACFIPVLKTNGPAYIIHIEEIVPLTLLGKGLLQGWQVIALTLVLAAISGIFMWLMDRNSNREDFPPNFFAGVWQGFWWAFVTMTTVGYGDTVPRSVPARMYSILWMIIGMIAFSVLTANITSSLSQKSFDAEEKMFGKRVGVLEGTMDAKAALMENAHIIIQSPWFYCFLCLSLALITFSYKRSQERERRIYVFKNVFNFLELSLDHQTVEELLRSLERGRVDGILVERYVAGAHYNQYKNLGMELGTLFTFPYNLGMQAPRFINGEATCAIFKKCINDILDEGQIATKVLNDLSNAWQNFEKAESSSLFEDESFFYILIAFFFALLGVGGLWHYFVYIPRQRQSIGDSESIQRETCEKYIFVKEELETLCEACKEKFDAILEQHPDREHHDSFLSLPFVPGAPNLKVLSANALSQLKRLPSNAADAVVPEVITGRRKRGRVT